LSFQIIIPAYIVIPRGGGMGGGGGGGWLGLMRSGRLGPPRSPPIWRGSERPLRNKGREGRKGKKGKNGLLDDFQEMLKKEVRKSPQLLEDLQEILQQVLQEREDNKNIMRSGRPRFPPNSPVTWIGIEDALRNKGKEGRKGKKGKKGLLDDFQEMLKKEGRKSPQLLEDLQEILQQVIKEREDNKNDMMQYPLRNKGSKGKKGKNGLLDGIQEMEMLQQQGRKSPQLLEDLQEILQQVLQEQEDNKNDMMQYPLRNKDREGRKGKKGLLDEIHEMLQQEGQKNPQLLKDLQEILTQVIKEREDNKNDMMQ
jgi:ElaB/YqjD/DUF883 family membrane-anchored ribosome-binding protein